jgi:hypothetical protein
MALFFCESFTLGPPAGCRNKPSGLAIRERARLCAAAACCKPSNKALLENLIDSATGVTGKNRFVMDMREILKRIDAVINGLDKRVQPQQAQP